MKIAARKSPLSRAQVAEIEAALPHLSFSCLFVDSPGDRDKMTSLRSLEKSDFFTRDLDRLVLEKTVEAAIHSAKDLPDPLPKGLMVAAITAGVDPRDCLVLRDGGLLEELPSLALIATSSERREEAVRQLRQDVRFCDLRGTIQERLSLLDRKEVDGVVVAEAALVRLGLRHLNRYFLPGSVALYQGQLAVVVHSENSRVQELFHCLDSRGKKRPWTILHLGLDPSTCPSQGRIYHYPVIRTLPLLEGQERLQLVWSVSTHVLFTSKSAVKYLSPSLSFKEKTVIAIGEGTAAVLRRCGAEPLVAKTATQEGIVELFEEMDLSQATLVWPRSSLSRNAIEKRLQEKRVNAHIIDLYQTVPHCPGHPPALDEIDEVVFMSPSCVEGFDRIYGSVEWKKRTAQGPVTTVALNKRFC